MSTSVPALDPAALSAIQSAAAASAAGKARNTMYTAVRGKSAVVELVCRPVVEDAKKKSAPEAKVLLKVPLAGSDAANDRLFTEIFGVCRRAYWAAIVCSKEAV